MKDQLSIAREGIDAAIASGVFIDKPVRRALLDALTALSELERMAVEPMAWTSQIEIDWAKRNPGRAGSFYAVKEGPSSLPLYAVAPPAQQQEPAIYICGDGRWVLAEYLADQPDKERFKIPAYAAPVAQQPQEPVACCYGGIAHDCHAGPGCRIRERLTAIPPAQQPQAEAVIDKCSECGKTSTKDNMWALYCVECIETKIAPAIAADQQPVATVQQRAEGGGVEAHLHHYLPTGTKLFAAPQQAEAVPDVVRDAGRLKYLIGAYWDLAYQEGKEGRQHDTPEGSAANCLAEINRAIDALAAAPKAEAVPSDVVRDAERYRWLRDASVPPHNFYIGVPDEFHGVRYLPSEVDAYIDAAIAAQGEKP